MLYCIVLVLKCEKNGIPSHRFNQQSLNIIKAQTNSEKEKLLDEIAAKNPAGGGVVANGQPPTKDIDQPKSKKVCPTIPFHL